MQATEMLDIIGASGMLRVSTGDYQLVVPVRVDDVRHAYGRTDYRVSPRGGIGWAWVQSDRVTLDSAK